MIRRNIEDAFYKVHKAFPFLRSSNAVNLELFLDSERRARREFNGTIVHLKITSRHVSLGLYGEAEELIARTRKKLGEIALNFEPFSAGYSRGFARLTVAVADLDGA